MDKPAYEVVQIDDKSWRIEENGVRSFLFVGSETSLLVDSGFGTGNLKAEIDKLTSLPVILVNTHTDRDHVGCNHQFPVIMTHPDDIKRYQTSEPTGQRNSLFGAIREGDAIDIGVRRFEVIHIPGHTPGSVALLDLENKILIGGDSVQLGAIFMFGPGRDINAYIESMKKLADMRKCFDVVYPSHGLFPVDSNIIDELITGAEQIRDGKIEGTKPPRDLPAKLYTVGRTNFLY